MQSVKDMSPNSTDISQSIMTIRPWKSVAYSATFAILDFWVDIPIQIYFEQLQSTLKNLEEVGLLPRRSEPSEEGKLNESHTLNLTG